MPFSITFQKVGLVAPNLYNTVSDDIWKSSILVIPKNHLVAKLKMLLKQCLYVSLEVDTSSKTPSNLSSSVLRCIYTRSVRFNSIWIEIHTGMDSNELCWVTQVRYCPETVQFQTGSSSQGNPFGNR